jgi:hypothetical protein
MKTVHTDLRAAIRSRLLTLSIASLTSSGISATASQILRASGSFITDGYGIGDEITVAGFANAANNGRALINAVAGNALTLDRVGVVEAAGAAITVALGLPQGRAWEGRFYSPVVGQPYFSETLLPISSSVRGIGPNGTIEHVVSAGLVLHYPSGVGTLAIEKMAGNLMELFRPGTSLVYGPTSGFVSQVERRPLLTEAEWISCPVTVTATAFS